MKVGVKGLLCLFFIFVLGETSGPQNVKKFDWSFGLELMLNSLTTH